MSWRTVAAILVPLGLIAIGAIILFTVVQDKVVIQDDSGQPGQPAQGVTVYLTGSRWGGCFCEFFALNDGSHEVGNVTGGPSVLAAFSDHNAVLFARNLPWTKLGGDQLPDESNPVNRLKPRIDLPIKVWILSNVSTTLQMAAAEVDDAHKVFDSNKTGINLLAKSIEQPNVQNLANAGCDSIQELTNNGVFDPSTVNVYYANSATCGGMPCDIGGVSCANDRRAAFVYATAGSRVLLHELGHALLGPDHWDPVVGKDNIMTAASGDTRSMVSAGQSIFMNYDKDSVLNTLRGKPGLLCAAECPSILIDPSFASCEVSPQPSAPVPSPIQTWFDCIECTGGELDAVLAGATDATIMQLIDALRPAPAAAAPAPPTVARSIDAAYEANDLARHQKRALTALTALAAKGDMRGIQAVRQAYENRQRYRVDVTEAIERAFRRIQ